MIGDILQDILYWLKQFFCWHNYESAEWLIRQPTHLSMECKKCGRLK